MGDPEDFAKSAQEQQVTRTGAPTIIKKASPDMPLWSIVVLFLLLILFCYLWWTGAIL